MRHKAGAEPRPCCVLDTPEPYPFSVPAARNKGSDGGRGSRMSSISVTVAWAAAFGLLAAGGAAAAGQGTAPAKKQAAKVPAQVVGEWYRGSVSLSRYVDATTGVYLGNGGGGSRTWLFAKDGTYKRYVYIDTGFGGTTLFAASEGAVTFSPTSPTEGTFTLRPKKGTYTYGTNAGNRPMGRSELERAGTAFHYRFEAEGEDGKPHLYIRRKEEAPSDVDEFDFQGPPAKAEPEAGGGAS